MDTLNVMGIAFASIITPTALMLMFFGCVVGIVFGAIPGLSGMLGVALLLPVTFGMSEANGFALLVSVWIGGVSGAFISATLLGIPGSTSSIATCYDAYPMCKKGQVVKALQAGILGSFLGTFVSCLIATFLSPIIARLALQLGPWEYFSLCACAIVLVVGLSAGDTARGLASAFLGILLCSVGFSPIDAYKRFTFGNYNLFGGIDVLALVLGMFAVRLILTDLGKGGIDTSKMAQVDFKGQGLTLKDWKNNIVNIVRSFFIGLWIGFLPGMGSGLSNMVAYAQAKSSSKHPEQFGEGIVDGVFASEVSNNASVGGAVIPMVALGIPGDSTTAILLGGLVIHGIEPGPLLFDQHGEFVYMVFEAVLLSAVAVLLIELFTMRWYPSILKIPYHYLYPALIAIAFVGAFTSTNTLFNCGMMLAMAALAMVMDHFKLPVSPLLLAYILGPMLEQNLRKGLTYSTEGFVTFLTRPVSALFLIVGLLSVVIPLLKKKPVQAESE